MPYLEGTESLADAITSRVVTFATPFSAAPDVIIPVVENTVDGSPLKLVAVVTAKSTTGFTATFSAATDSANYRLAWIAGSATAVFATVAEGSRRTADIPVSRDEPLDSDHIVTIQSSPRPRTVRNRWQDIYALFMRFVSSAPADPADEGTVSKMAVDGDYAYIHNGTSWGRFPLNTDDWDSDDALHIRQSGLTALANATQVHTITFPTAFITTAPKVWFSIENQSGDTILLLHGVITERTLEDFTVTLSAPTDSTDYKIYWEAVQS